MRFTHGSRVRFEATFTVGGKVVEPRWVTATVRTPLAERRFTATELERVRPGAYAIEVVARELGPMTVRFEADTGEFSETAHDVAPAQVTELAAAELPEPEPIAPEPEPIAPPPPPPARAAPLRLKRGQLATTSVVNPLTGTPHQHAFDAQSSGGRTTTNDGHDHAYAKARGGKWVIVETEDHAHDVADPR